MSTRTHEVGGQPEDEPRRDTGRIETQQERPRVSQDRLRDLINALGDPNHPLHSQAVNDLVDTGETAVPALSAALSPNYPWLTSYRAAEALAQIGDGRASGALINALRHPNSNVRWSVVRALSEVGDTRTLLALRRVVQEDHGKTSWGESVADTAQLALDRLQSRSALLRFSEPIKTALVFVAMLAVLAFAGNRVQALRDELNNTTRNAPAPIVGAAGTPAETATAEPEASPTAELPTTTPSAQAADEVVGTVRASGNVRNGPSRDSRRIGQVSVGDELVFLAKSGTWYRVRLGEQRADTSEIQGGEGWVSEILVNVPDASVPPAETATP
jgi:hypothetical protein